MASSPVSHWTLLGSLGTGLAIVLGLSGSCDKAIEARIDSLRREMLKGDSALDERLDLLERPPKVQP